MLTRQPCVGRMTEVSPGDLEKRGNRVEVRGIDGEPQRLPIDGGFDGLRGLPFMASTRPWRRPGGRRQG